MAGDKVSEALTVAWAVDRFRESLAMPGTHVSMRVRDVEIYVGPNAHRSSDGRSVTVDAMIAVIHDMASEIAAAMLVQMERVLLGLLEDAEADAQAILDRLAGMRFAASAGGV